MSLHNIHPFSQTLCFNPLSLSTGNVSGSGDRLKDISRGFDSSAWDSAFLWLGWAGAAAVVLGIIWVAIRIQKADSSVFGSSYRNLARGLGLQRKQWALVNKVARQHGLVNGAGLLISRGTFDHWTTLYLRGANNADKDHRYATRELSVIRVHLFAKD